MRVHLNRLNTFYSRDVPLCGRNPKGSAFANRDSWDDIVDRYRCKKCDDLYTLEALKQDDPEPVGIFSGVADQGPLFHQYGGGMPKSAFGGGVYLYSFTVTTAEAANWDCGQTVKINNVEGEIVSIERTSSVNSVLVTRVELQVSR